MGPTTDNAVDLRYNGSFDNIENLYSDRPSPPLSLPTAENAQWGRTDKNRDISTGKLARPLALHCSLCSLAFLLTYSLPSS